MPHEHDHDPLQPHRHDPNPQPPHDDPAFTLHAPGGKTWRITTSKLHALPRSHVAGCYIVSTGHGISGPFTFGGVRLIDLLDAYMTEPWDNVGVISADGFGNRVFRHELQNPDPAGPILLATTQDGTPLDRASGLVRLIVPSERDDALRQVKWIARIEVHAGQSETSPV